MVRRITMLAVSCVALLAQTTLAAEPASPVAGACGVEPRTLVELLGLKKNQGSPVAFNPESQQPTPVATPVGAPASDAEAAAFQETIRLLVTCLNEGEYWRMLSLYSDRYVASILSQLGVLDQAAYDALAIPRPVPPERLTTIVTIGEVVTQDDGRLAAVVVTRLGAEGGPLMSTVFQLSFNGERWQIDEFTPVLP